MTISGLALACKSYPSVHPSLFHCIHKVGFSSIVAAIENFHESYMYPLRDSIRTSHDNHVIGKIELDRVAHAIKPSSKKLNAKVHGISTSMIDKPTKEVFDGLKKKGYKAYLVGGVRDLTRNLTPKGFRIITSAPLTVVLSYATCALKFSRDFGYEFEGTNGCGDGDYMQHAIYLQPDCTINSLMFEPYAKVVYDYSEGTQDIKEKVRTSSVEECGAWILRSIRIAGHFRGHLSNETAHHLFRRYSLSILRLDKGKILKDMNYMLGYGSAVDSLMLLWRFRLLDALLPFQAAYFRNHGLWRVDKESYNMLLSLFHTLDEFVAPKKPCHSSLWVAILAFHKALHDQPRDAFVVAAFSFAIDNGGDLLDALKMANHLFYDYVRFHELLEPEDLEDSTLEYEVMNLATSVEYALSKMVDELLVSNMVFISPALYMRVKLVFECLKRGYKRSLSNPSNKISLDSDVGKMNPVQYDYELLALGSLEEVRHTFARVVISTLFYPDWSHRLN